MSKKLKVIIPVAAFFLAFGILFVTVINPWLATLKGDDTEPVPLEPGEAYYTLQGKEFTDTPVIFPQIDYSSLFQLVVHNADGEEYMFYHYLGGGKNHLYLGQYGEDGYDEEGQPTFYAPQISSTLAGFDYTSLYDGEIKIPTLISLAGSVIFDQRVYKWTAADDATEVQKQLHKYGLADSDDAPWFEIMPFLTDRNGRYIYTVATEDGSNDRPVYFDASSGKYYYIEGVSYDEAAKRYVYDPAYEYKDDPLLLTVAGDGELAQRVYVGLPTADDGGYYLRLAGRNTVYTAGSLSSDMTEFDYRTLVGEGLDYYVNPMLITPPASNYDPFYTPDFTLSSGVYTDTEGAAVTEGSTVYITYNNGYPDLGTLTVEASNSGNYLERLVTTLSVGRAGLTLAQLSPRQAPLSAGDTVSYDIIAIEGIYDPLNFKLITASTDPDRRVQPADLVAVRYTDGTPAQSDSPTYNHGGQMIFTGILDLSALPSDLSAQLVGLSIASLSDSISLSHAYAPSGHAETYRYDISSIDDISGSALAGTKVQNGDRVTFTYSLYIDGKYSSSGTATLTVDTDSSEVFVRRVSEKLLGKKKGQQSLSASVIYDDEGYMQDYKLYYSCEIGCTVSYETDLSFSYYIFAGDGKMDPFMEDVNYIITGPESLRGYALNTDAVMNILASWSSLTGTEGGLSGTRTECIGISPEIMKKYGLYAHHLSYTLPFGTTGTEDEEGNTTALSSRYQLVYNLYISDAKDGKRYVWSDQYGIVAEVSAEIFDFADWDFLSDWARNYMILTDISYIKYIEIESGYDDDDSHFSFALNTDPAFKYMSGGEEYTAEKLYVAYTEGKVVTGTPYLASSSGLKIGSGMYTEQLSDGSVYVTPIVGAADLDAIYAAAGHTEGSGIDYAGVYQFRHFVNTLYSISYSGSMEGELSEADQQALITSGDRLVLTLRIGALDGRTFVFRFYNFSPRRSMVAVTQLAADGTELSSAHGFYIGSTETAKLLTYAKYLRDGKLFAEDDIY